MKLLSFKIIALSAEEHKLNNNIIALAVAAFFPFMASAQPNIEGTPSELESYLNGLPKIVTLSAQATKDAPVNKALVKVRVVSESPSLAKAFEANLKIRLGIRSQLKDAGVDPENINESKFSSAPEYGMFSEKPKSYKIENVLSIVVTSESQLIKVASAVDSSEDVYFVSSNAKSGDSGEIEKELIAKALAKVKEKASLYENELGVKLTPVLFSESISGMPSPVARMQKRRSELSSYGVEADAMTVSFGESKHNITVTVNYRIEAK